MTFLWKEESRPFYMTENYAFDKLNFKSEPNVGLLICYFLTKVTKDIMITLTLKSKETNGWRRVHTDVTLFKLCPNNNIFLAIYESSDFGTWELDIINKGTVLSLSGEANSFLVRVSHDKESNVNLEPLLREIEARINDLCLG